jgi:hypothetical protein
MKLDKVIKFFKSKSVVDVVYLVMMILIVTMIKDMIVSMYRKRKDKQWLNQAFGKTKGKKNVEGFSTGTTWTTASTCVSPIDDTTSVCDRLKFLLCNDNFNKFIKLMNAITTEKETDKLNINTNGGFINTKTPTGGGFINAGGLIYANGGINTVGGNINTGGGNINTAKTGETGGEINTGGGEINTGGGNIVTGNDFTGNYGKIRVKFLEVQEIRPFMWSIGNKGRTNNEDYVTIRAETYFKPGPTNSKSRDISNNSTYFRIYANGYYDATNNNSRKGIQIQQVSANGDVGFLSKKSAGSDGDNYAEW